VEDIGTVRGKEWRGEEGKEKKRREKRRKEKKNVGEEKGKLNRRGLAGL
jgi:hypothetical protein